MRPQNQIWCGTPMESNCKATTNVSNDQRCTYLCFEAGSDPRGHLWVTWGVYLCAGKPPLADIILSYPPDLT